MAPNGHTNTEKTGKKMLEILQFVFSGFWHFVGTVVLIGTIGASATAVAAAIRG